MEGLFIPTCCESNWLNHDFFRFKTEKKENVVDDMFPWKTSEIEEKCFSNSGGVCVLERDEITNLKI